jgi:hypothetical protein
MPWLRILVSAVVASELLVRFPLIPALGRARAAADKSGRLLRSKRVSDHWKERMLPVYAGAIARNSLIFFGLLCVAILPVILIGYGYPGGLTAWLSVLMKPVSIALLCALSILYLIVRTRLARTRSGRG